MSFFQESKRNQNLGPIIETDPSRALLIGGGVLGAAGLLWTFNYALNNSELTRDNRLEKPAPAVGAPAEDYDPTTNTTIMTVGPDGNNLWQMARKAVGPEERVEPVVDEFVAQASDNNGQPGFQPDDVQPGQQYVHVIDK